MACGGCNTFAPVTKDQVENIIQKAIDTGKIQSGLKTCEGEDLPAKSKVVVCRDFEGLLKESDFDKTIVKGANEAGKFGVKAKSNGGLELTGDGVGVKVKDGKGLALTSDGLEVKVKSNGGLEATENGVGVKAGDGLKVGEDGSLQLGEIFAKKPIIGKGTKADPLAVEFSDKDFVVNPATGVVSLKPSNIGEISDLDAGKPSLGYSSFFGYVDKARGVYVKGVPSDIKSEEASQQPTSRVDQLKDGEDYDFNGWQVASPAQVDQYLVGDDRAVWHRVNDGGMNQDGSLKAPTEWSAWRRETNVSVNLTELIALQKQVLDLTGRVAALEEILAGFVPLKDASGNTQIGLIKP